MNILKFKYFRFLFYYAILEFSSTISYQTPFALLLYIVLGEIIRCVRKSYEHDFIYDEALKTKTFNCPFSCSLSRLQNNFVIAYYFSHFGCFWVGI